MDKEILKQYSSGTAEGLEELLKKTKIEQLTTLLDDYAVRGKGDSVTLLRAVLQGSPVSSKDGSEKRCAVFKHIVLMLNSQDLCSKTSAEFIGFLLMEADSLPTSGLTALMDVFVESIRAGISGGKALELFPKILSTLECRDVVVVGEGQMKGTEYKSHILNTICSCRWESSTVLQLASMFKEVRLSSEELLFVVDKILRMLNELDLQELPPLIYQLMRLASNGPKRKILDGIVTFFVEKDLEKKRSKVATDVLDELDAVSSPLDQLHHVEGTVILHISFAMRHDHDLAKQFIKYYKEINQESLGKALAPFTVAVALSTSDLMGFTDQVFELLKTTIYRSYKNAERCIESNCVRDFNQEDKHCAEMILDAVKNSIVGWDHILQGLVRLGFTLMESYGPKSCFGKVCDTQAAGGRLTAAQKSCQLGSDLLHESFKNHEIVRDSIVDQLINHIVTKAAGPVSHYIGLLTGLVRTCPQVLLGSVSRLKETFDYLTYLPLNTCETFLAAIQPLLKISVSLRDALVLVLRKALFSRQVEARRVAASAFLMLIGNFKLLGNLSASQMSYSSSQSCSYNSQIAMDIHSQAGSSSRSLSESICLDVLGSLRRCLVQQAEVRLILYEGLVSVSKSNPQLSSPIINQLKTQFLKYYDAGPDALPPIKLDPCITVQGEDIVTAEPLAHLLDSLIHCYMMRKCVSDSNDDDNDNDDDSCYDDVKKILDSLIDRMIKCEPEDFELDKSADYSTETSVGVRNTILVVLVCGVYETMIEYCFESVAFSCAGFDQLLKLFQNLKRLSEVLKEKPANSGAGGSKKGAGKSKDSSSTSGSASTSVVKSCGLLSLGFLNRALSALYNDDIPAHQEALKTLRASTDMQRYLLTAVTDKLSQIQQSGRCDGPDGRNNEKLYQNCACIAGVLLNHYIACLQSAGPDNRPAKNRGIVSQCIETVYSAVNVVTSRNHKKVQTFLQALASSDSKNRKEDLTEQELLNKQIRKFQRMVITVLTSGDEERSLKDVATLLNIIFTLSQCVDNNNNIQSLAELQQWTLSLCKEQSLDDLVITKLLMTQLLSLSRQTCESLPIVQILARDLHLLLGDIDQEVEMSGERTFALVTHRAAAAVLILVLNHVDKEIEDTEVIVSRLKSSVGSSSRISDTQEENVDRTVCSRLVNIINSFHELLQSVIPLGQSVETLFKVLLHLYTLLTNLVKWKLSQYSSNHGHISSRFEKLIKLTGSHLTQCVYSTITYVQVSQTEQLQMNNDKGKKKAGKKTNTSQPQKGLIMKETRSIPNLIYAIEQYEKYLIQLTKKSKVDLMSHFKMSTSRDFRINVATLQAALAPPSESEDENETMEEAGDGEAAEGSDKEDEAPPASKKPKQDNTAANTTRKTLSTSNKTNVKHEPVAKGRKKLGTK